MNEWLQKLAGFSSGSPGVTRLLYDGAWCDAHAWLSDRARSLGLVATPDALGNLLLHPPSARPGDLARPVLLIGSHLDTVANDGSIHGASGVLIGLLVAAELRASEALPVVAFASCGGEENRFGVESPGARGLLGLVEDQELDFACDSSGTSWRRALEQARARGCATPPGPSSRPCAPLFRPALVIETHVEQGPVLDTELFDLGLVESVAGCRRLSVKLTGETRRAGTTPMKLRRDALAAASAMALVAETLARQAGPEARAGAGYAIAKPGTMHEVPGACELGIEVRHGDHARLAELADAIGRRCRTIACERGIEIVLEESAGADPVAFPKKLVDAAEEQAKRLGIQALRMTSGASHDAAVFARNGAPALLLLSPSRRGVSHSPEEYTSAAQLEAARRFVSEFARWLTSER
ncbi:MAG TPA: hydantoinase/carbamoylase family amidase [Terriglobales bacterium]|nr:hydantoinase/carbamoylase family amidase [Terriglobales bacterium]